MKHERPADLVFTRNLPASADEVYDAWTSPEVMRQWLAPGANVVIEIESDLRIGGAFLIRSQAPDGQVHTIRGLYRELTSARRIAMTWTYAGPIELLCAMETLLEIDLQADDTDHTTMTFTQSRLTTQDAATAFAGDWPSCFDKLQGLFGAANFQK